jgi:hypothetical protein
VALSERKGLEVFGELIQDAVVEVETLAELAKVTRELFFDFCLDELIVELVVKSIKFWRFGFDVLF